MSDQEIVLTWSNDPASFEADGAVGIVTYFLEGYGTRTFIPVSSDNVRVRYYQDGEVVEHVCRFIEEHELRQDPPVYEEHDGGRARYFSPSGRLHPDDDVAYSRFMFGNLIEDGRNHVDRDFPWPYTKTGKMSRKYLKEVSDLYKRDEYCIAVSP